MLAYMGDRQYAFVHRTFLEYFRARDLKYQLEKTKDFTIDDLRRFYRDGWPQEEWREVLRLLSGLIGPEHAGACSDELLRQENSENGHQAVVLAAQCLQEVREEGLVHDVRARVRARLEALTGYDLPYYSRRYDWKAQQEVTRVRTTAVQGLARGWKSDPDTVVLLKQRAAQDDSGSVRQAAVRELARVFQSYPDTVVWLKQHAAQDDNESVRRAAVQELARVGNPTPTFSAFSPTSKSAKPPARPNDPNPIQPLAPLRFCVLARNAFPSQPESQQLQPNPINHLAPSAPEKLDTT